MITISWKEIATKTDSIDKVLKLAKALDNTGLEEPILVFFEFANPKDLILFCNTFGAIKAVGSLDKLQEEKRKLNKEIDRLQVEKDKLHGQLDKLEKVARMASM